jgi:hypothetical protein
VCKTVGSINDTQYISSFFPSTTSPFCTGKILIPQLSQAPFPLGCRILAVHFAPSYNILVSYLRYLQTLLYYNSPLSACLKEQTTSALTVRLSLQSLIFLLTQPRSDKPWFMNTKLEGTVKRGGRGSDKTTPCHCSGNCHFILRAASRRAMFSLSQIFPFH